MVVIVGRVSPDRVEHSLIGVAASVCQECLIRREVAFFLVIESVETNILQSTAATCGGKSVCYSRLRRYLTPLSGCPRLTAIYWHTAFIELLAVAQHIFRNLTKVYIKVATVEIAISLFA